MKYTVHLSSRAMHDIRSVVSYLRDESRDNAIEWILGIEGIIQSLAQFPHRGVVCNVSGESEIEIRRVFYQRFAIYFAISTTRVDVAFIQHMAKKPLDSESLMNDVRDVLRLDKIINLIDAANAADPNSDTLDGVTGPKELIYGKRMQAWVETINPRASDELKIAARAQHICRWEIPRTDYPEGKAGYYQWRTYLYGYHAEKTGVLMREAGYPGNSIERVRVIMDKKNLRKDPDTQTLEDAAALVFLENHLAEFSGRDDVDEEKMIDILRKTWGKMSQAGHDAALNLVLPPESAALVGKALNG